MPDNPDTMAHPLTDSAANRLWGPLSAPTFPSCMIGPRKASVSSTLIIPDSILPVPDFGTKSDNDSLIHSAIGNPQSGSAARPEVDPLSSARLFFVIAGLKRLLFLAYALLTPGLGASQRVSIFANVGVHSEPTVLGFEIIGTVLSSPHSSREFYAEQRLQPLPFSESCRTVVPLSRDLYQLLLVASLPIYDGRLHPKFTACGNMQISGHELWALGQWELVFAVLLGLASSISGLAAPPEVTEAVQQLYGGGPPLQVGRSRKLKIYLPYALAIACGQGDTRENFARNTICQPIVLLPESITRVTYYLLPVPGSPAWRCAMSLARVRTLAGSSVARLG
ncbi:hypothetical protein EDB87DRAFT_1576481 [Lactarius vividus]|nr:hypothetical protein EDB87DRAFT_1576481 [Lactarius vividus]